MIDVTRPDIAATADEVLEAVDATRRLFGDLSEAEQVRHLLARLGDDHSFFGLFEGLLLAVIRATEPDTTD